MVADPTTTARKMISISREIEARIADYRFENRIGSESEAIRQIIEAGLAALDAQSRASKRKTS